MRIENLVAFLILMGCNVQGKSPDYILEKFNRYVPARENESYWGLDSENTHKLAEWEEQWLKK